MRNIRVFLETLKRQGNLAEVGDEVSWSLEAPAMFAASAEKNGPALHFARLKGSTEGSLVSGLYSGPTTLFPQNVTYWQNAATGLDFEREVKWSDFLAKLMERYQHQILPIEVGPGPVKEKRMSDDEVDITNFPIPFVHRGDGGRYITLATLIIKDPETEWEVWRAPRFMVVDGKTLVGVLRDGTPEAKVFAKYKSMNRPMPFSIVIGPPPAVTMVSYLAVPEGESCAGVAGGLNLDPIELNRAETNSMMVPSQAEMILEGEAWPQEVAEEGPYPEFWFYTEKAPCPVFRIKTVTYRSDPIIPFSVDGAKPYDDNHNLMSVLMAFELYRRCWMVRNFPVSWIQIPLEFNLSLALVSAPILMHGYVAWLGKYLLSQSRDFEYLFNKVLVVDTMIPDIALEESIVELGFKAHPVKAFRFVDGMRLGPNTRCANTEQRKTGIGSGLYIDATWPKDWTKEDIPRRVGIEGSYPEELIGKVRENWRRLGLKGKPIIYPESLRPH